MKFLFVAFLVSLAIAATPTHAATRCPCTCNMEDGTTRGITVEGDGEGGAQSVCETQCAERFGGGSPDVVGVVLDRDSCVEIAPPAEAPAAPAEEKAASAAIPKLVNPLGEGTTTNILIGRIINALLGIVGSIALLMFVYGGFMWLTSGGAEDKIKKGKETLVWASLGLVIIFSAYALLNFVLTRALGLI